MTYSKPCVVCGKSIMRPHPSQLTRVSAHNGCKGALITQRAAARRNDQLSERWAKYSPEIRVLLAETYNLGARHMRERIRMRYRMRQIATETRVSPPVGPREAR